MSSKLKVQQLRDELLKRGLDSTGLKPALVSRLDEAIALESHPDNATAKDDEAPPETDKDDGKKNDKKTHPRDDEKKNDKKTHARDDDSDAPAKRLKVDDVDKLGVDELKSSLAALGCSTTGSKAALRKRLISALQEQNLQDGDDTEDVAEKRVTAMKKGRAVLNSNLPENIKANFHVLEEGEDIFDAMLNQTNVGGNNNKYYVIQALENDAGTSYQLFTRWGRVGANGQSKLLMCESKSYCISQFKRTFYDKTRNDWDTRHLFQSHPGKYTLLEMDYEAEEKPQAIEKGGKKVDEQGRSGATAPRQPSKLNPVVEKLVSLICNISMMKQEMMEIGYDARKMPLGKLSKSTILKGYAVLKRIAAALEHTGDRHQLEQLSSEFYTVIPHDFGFKKMRHFIIDTPQLLKKKLEMVEALGEIELATKLLEVDNEEDPAFYHYQRLKCAIEPVLMDGDEADWIKKYLHDTHGATHSRYTLSAEQIFKVVREGEDGRFNPFAGAKNRMLLWHGSRLCNWTGILSQGLRIAPPEAPVTGYMFGKGVYFADMSSKSANYCYPNQKDPVGLLLLCEVALGDMRELLQADYHADQLPQGKLSTKGVGTTAPDPKGQKVLPDGVVVPMGKPIPQKVPGAYLNYNEFIVYDTAQIRMRYLLMVRFN